MVLEIDNKKVAERLKSFLESKYGSIPKAAKALGKTPENLRNGYLNGRSIPGPDLLLKLADAGCDIYYLLTSISWIKNYKLFDEGVGNRVAQIRKELNLSKSKFGKLVSNYDIYNCLEEKNEDWAIDDYSAEYCKNWENGIFSNFQFLINISHLGNISLFWLLTGEKPPYSDINDKKDNLSKNEEELLSKIRLVPESMPIINKLLEEILVAKANSEEIIKRPKKK